jgi:UDP-N-acetyl-D-mannosaminuronic acid dehydrogenase
MEVYVFEHSQTGVGKSIVVIGLGYIGLPTAALLASRKTQVIGVDINPVAVSAVNAGQIHIIEPELDIIVRAAVSEGYLRATQQMEAADVFIIAVPTPFKENHVADLSYIEASASSLAPVLKKGDLIILESTSPVGATEQLAEWLEQKRPDLTFPHRFGENSDIRLAYCPERVLPGHVLRELVQNDRVIGGITPMCSARAVEVYSIFTEGVCVTTDVRTAEMCKLTENSFRDVNIAFANELSMICSKLDIDVNNLIKLANHHPRVNILQSGPGVGGHCIAVDPWFIVSKTPEEARLIRTAREVNDQKTIWVVEKIETAIAEFLEQYPEKTARDVTVACFGLTFKADIDDLRESPALKITKQIAEKHAGPVVAVEPNVNVLPDEIAHTISQRTMEDALLEADILVKLVNHKAFTSIEQKAFNKQAKWLNFCGQ